MSLIPQTISKGGRLRSLFTSTSPVPPSPTPKNAQTALQGSADLRTTSAIPMDPLERFATKDKIKVGSLEPTNVIGIDATVAEAHTYTDEHRSFVLRRDCRRTTKLTRYIYSIKQTKLCTF